MNRMRLSCQQASRLLSMREDAPLKAAERLKLWMHLGLCDACRNVVRQWQSIRLAVRRFRDEG